MIRAALALYEATGEQSLPRPGAGLAARARSRLRQCRDRNLLSHRRRRRRPGHPSRRDHRRSDAEPQRGRGAKSDPAWRCWPATIAGANKADRLIAAIAPQAVENLYMHMALLNAVDLRLRAAEIVVTGEGARAQALLAAARALSAARPHRAACRVAAERCRRNIRRAAKIAAAERAAGFRLRRRNLLAAGHRSGRPHWRHRCGATYLTRRFIRGRFVLYWQLPGRSKETQSMRYGIDLGRRPDRHVQRPAPAPTTNGAAMPPATTPSSNAAIRASPNARTPSARAACASSIRTYALRIKRCRRQLVADALIDYRRVKATRECRPRPGI